ncbi:MAG: response regulator [Thermodesulfovibrionia bacterium]|nr:response regulator [Thermodesulfovibrionia bacterium]
MQGKPKILIVDDQLELREVIRFVLKDKYLVAAVTGAEEAFKYMADNPVNLVLLDINMPKIDGITALQEIKKSHPETEIIFVTAYATLETIRKALNLGAFGFLMKPFDHDKLINIVDEALKNRDSNKS